MLKQEIRLPPERRRTIMVDTGMRPEEVCRMRWEHVHLEPVNGARFGLCSQSLRENEVRETQSVVDRTGAIPVEHASRGRRKTQRDGCFLRTTSHRRPVPYATIDSQHDRALAQLNAPDDEGNDPEDRCTI